MIGFAAQRLAFGGGPRRKNTIRRLRGGILGLALSLVPLTVVVHVAEGMVQGITVRYLETGTGHIRLIGRLPDGGNRSAGALETLRSIDGVRTASAERSGLGLLRSDSGNAGVQIRGVEPEWYTDDPAMIEYLDIIDGGFDLSSPDSLVIGEALAAELSVSPGDEVRLVTVRRGSTGSLLPRVSRFTVTGIVSSGYRDLDRLWIFIPLDRARVVVPDENANELVTVKIDDPYDLPNPLVRHDIERGTGLVAEIGARLSADWRVYTWFELERSEFMNFLGTKNMLVFIMVVILLVAGVNIATTMINIVTERQQEFAVLKALGAKPGKIALIVLAIGGMSGIIGVAIGLGAGSVCVIFINEIILGIERAINLFVPAGSEIRIINPEFYLERIPVELLPLHLTLQGVLALAMSVAASLVPALKAGRMRPAVLFRRE